MPLNTLITDEGENHILSKWYDAISTHTMTLYGIVGTPVSPSNAATFADVAGMVDEDVKSVDPPLTLTLESGTTIAGDAYAKVRAVQWGVHNATGSTALLNGFLIVDETDSKLIMLTPSGIVIGIPAGSTVYYDIEIWLQGATELVPG